MTQTKLEILEPSPKNESYFHRSENLSKFMWKKITIELKLISYISDIRPSLENLIASYFLHKDVNWEQLKGERNHDFYYLIT